MFTRTQKLKAISITHIFESYPPTPAGDPSTVVVLPDGAGITYGISQDTHGSGNLARVIDYYLEQSKGDGKLLNELYFQSILPQIKDTGKRNRMAWARNRELQRILRETGKTLEMRKAQERNMNRRLSRAIKACEGSGFVTTMALAVIYDSMNHGSWERIRDRIRVNRSNYGSQTAFERAWLTQYVTRRDLWLEKHPKVILRRTDYRTDFFLAQISRKNWNINLPVNVHGFRLRDSHIDNVATMLHEDEIDTTEKTVIEFIDERQANQAVVPLAKPHNPDSDPSSSKPEKESETARNNIPENLPAVTPSIVEQPPFQNAIQNKGDEPQKEARWKIKLQDWKPWCIRQAKKLFGLFTGFNVAQVPTFAGLGVKFGGVSYWWIGIAFAGVLVLTSTILVVLIGGGIFVFFLWNRRELNLGFMRREDSRADPDSYNLGVDVEKKL